jgi:3-hydroxyisobutyrate dehydrogenase-like beta-hydroxyacid dehydrogenase
MATTVAFLGLGHMGQAMVRRLLQAGFHLRVWDRTPGRVKAGPGLQVFGTAREAVSGARFVMTSPKQRSYSDGRITPTSREV